MFLDPVDLRVVADAGPLTIYETLAPFRYRCEEQARTYIVPARFIFDGASVPRIPVAWLMFGGKGLRAACLHDFLYCHGIRLGMISSRKESDDAFYFALLDTGHTMDEAEAFYSAVRWFGGGRFVA